MTEPKSHLNRDTPEPFEFCSDETRVAIEMLAIKLFEHDNAKIIKNLNYAPPPKAMNENWCTYSHRILYRKIALEFLKEPLL